MDNMIRYSNQIANLPEPLNIYRMLINGDHLHFGYWPQEDVCLSLEEAQDKMFKKIASVLPNPPGKILDVGCGLGQSSALLAAQGYEVTAVAPAESLISYAKKKYIDTDAEFVVANFMDDNFYGTKAEIFDIIFLQESLQYLHPLNKAISKIYRLLKKDGSVLISDEVCISPDIYKKNSVHMLKKIKTCLAENFFKIKSCKDVGCNVSQTCSIIINRINIYYEDILDVLLGNNIQYDLAGLLNGWNEQKVWYESGKYSYIILHAKKDRFKINKYEPGDENDILRMFNNVFLANRTMDHWQWKFEGNPFGNLNIALARSESGDLAAHFCAYPVEFYCKRSEEPECFTSAQAGDTMTNPAYRSAGLGKTGILARTAYYFYNKFCKDNYPFIYGYNTGNIKKLGERYLGYKYIYPVPYFSLDSENISRLKAKRWPFINLIKVRKQNSIDNDIDNFFQDVCDDYSMLVKRDSNYIKWRYFDCPDKEYKFYKVSQYGKILGWSVFSSKDDKLIWGDCLFRKDSLKYLISLLQFVINDNPHVNQIDGWFSMNPAWWPECLKNLGFTIIEEPNNLYPCFKFFNNDFTLKYLEDNLYFTMGDSDLF